MILSHLCFWSMPRALAAVLLLLGTTSLLAEEARPEAAASRQPDQTKNDRENEPAEPESPEFAAIRATAKAFTKAFNNADAQALAELWTENGEYVGPDGNPLIGPARIEAVYAEFFKTHPAATLELTIDSIRLLGPRIAVEEGTSRLQLSDDASEPSLGRYRALHVRGEDGWQMASVREWAMDPATAVTLKDIAWIVGEWKATNDDVSTRVVYDWDDGKAFITGSYTLSRGDEVVSQGTEIIARDPAGGLRSWRFDASGGFSEGFWNWDGRAWTINSSGIHSDGTETLAILLLTPQDENAFTWQVISRPVNGVDAVGTRPIKVIRVTSPTRQ